MILFINVVVFRLNIFRIGNLLYILEPTMPRTVLGIIGTTYFSMHLGI